MRLIVELNNVQVENWAIAVATGWDLSKLKTTQTFVFGITYFCSKSASISVKEHGHG